MKDLSEMTTVAEVEERIVEIARNMPFGFVHRVKTGQCTKEDLLSPDKVEGVRAALARIIELRKAPVAAV